MDKEILKRAEEILQKQNDFNTVLRAGLCPKCGDHLKHDDDLDDSLFDELKCLSCNKTYLRDIS